MTIKNIVLFKLNQLGDSVVFLPTLSGIRRHFPESHILIVCNNKFQSIYTHTVPGISVLGLDLTKGRRGFHPDNIVSILRQIGFYRYDHALLSFDEPSLAYGAAWMGRVRSRIGFELCRHRLRPLLTRALAGAPGRNVVDVNFDLVRYLVGDPALVPTRVPVGYDGGDVQVVDQWLRRAGVNPEAPFVLMHPHSKEAYRCWPLHRYAELSVKLWAMGIPSVVLAQEVSERVGSAVPLRDLTLPQLAALSARARLFVGNNSGPLHVAASVGTSTLAITGPSAPEWRVPWLDVPHGQICADDIPCAPCERFGQPPPAACANHARPQGCLVAISVDQVLQRALALLR